MRELTFRIPDLDRFIAEKQSLEIQLPACRAELWPLALEHEETHPWSFFMRVNGDGLITVSAVTSVLLANILPPFCFIDSFFLIKLEAEGCVRAILYDDHDERICKLHPRSGSFVNMLAQPKDFAAHENRIALKIVCAKPSQLSIDLKNDAETVFSSISLDHQDGYANVYHDVCIDGLWQRDQRTKLGFVKYEIGKPYSCMFAACYGKLRLSILSLDEMKTFTAENSGSLASAAVRESWCSNPEGGQYEVEELK